MKKWVHEDQMKNKPGKGGPWREVEVGNPPYVCPICKKQIGIEDIIVWRDGKSVHTRCAYPPPPDYHPTKSAPSEPIWNVMEITDMYGSNGTHKQNSRMVSPHELLKRAEDAERRLVKERAQNSAELVELRKMKEDGNLGVIHKAYVSVLQEEIKEAKDRLAKAQAQINKMGNEIGELRRMKADMIDVVVGEE